MKKEEQLKENRICKKVFAVAIKEMKQGYYGEPERLRTCSARVFETKHFYILQSYNTLIACISKQTDTLYDLLRYEYGYTRTSAQHIAKFNKDYCRGYFGCDKRYTWKQV